MNGTSEKLVVLFHTSSHAIRAEKLLRRAGLTCKLVPVPRHLSSDCGVCARIDTAHHERACAVLREGRVEIVGVFAPEK